MHLQNQIINAYKQTFGPMTINSIARHTNIQATRVYRILNGKPMKLEEYEVFNKLIFQKKSTHTSYDNFLTLAQQCAKSLSPKNISLMSLLMERKLSTKYLLES